eukprot:scaffold73723_cov67-Attheya_sp.AAC.1
MQFHVEKFALLMVRNEKTIPMHMQLESEFVQFVNNHTSKTSKKTKDTNLVCAKHGLAWGCAP